jgi:hypothetical protein
VCVRAQSSRCLSLFVFCHLLLVEPSNEYTRVSLALDHFHRPGAVADNFCKILPRRLFYSVDRRHQYSHRLSFGMVLNGLGIKQ